MKNPTTSTKLLVIPVLGLCLLSWMFSAPSRSLAVASSERSIAPVSGADIQVTVQEELATDDGSAETGVLTDGLIIVNRLTPANFPATLQIIRIFFAPFQGFPNPTGSQIRLLAFAGAPGSTQPANNPTLLVNQVVTIPAVSANGGFIDFPVQNGPSISGGDFYVGFQAPNPTGGVIFAADASGPQQQRAFYSTNNGATYQGPLVLISQQQLIPVNILIRAVVSEEAPAGPSINVQPPALDFGTVAPGATAEQALTVRNTGSAPLSLTGASINHAQFSLAPLTLPLTIDPGGQQTITVRFNPTGNGAQSGTLTITSNDPAKPTVTVLLTGSGDTAPLISGTPQTGSIGAPVQVGGGVLGSTQYTILVPNGATQLKVDLTGNQDVDLYVRFGQRVAISNGRVAADFTSETDSNFESVTITPANSPALQAGTYFIAVGNFGPGAANFTVTATITGGNQVATVSAASFAGTELASEAIVAAFGTNLATTTQVAATLPLPTSLAGTTVKVTDSAGTERLAPLFFVSPGQINYQIPPNTQTGVAIVTVTSGGGTVSIGAVQIATVAPGLFSANSDGQGVAAAVALRVKADSSQSTEPVARFDPAQGKSVSVPIDLGPETDQVFLLLFGTGVRFGSALSAASAKIGGGDAQVLYAGAQGGFVGLDQLNVRVPRSLVGRGEIDIVLTVDGKPANTVRVNIK